MESFKGKHSRQYFEPLPLKTIFFPVMRHREKTSKQEWEYWRTAASLRGVRSRDREPLLLWKSKGQRSTTAIKGLEAFPWVRAR